MALEILRQWGKKQEPIGRIMEEVLQRHPLADPRDRHLAFALVYGVMRWQGYLDRVLADFSSYPPVKMKPLILQALRTCLFQMLFMDRIPEAAAINETIEILKASRQPKWLLGFANGLLRAIGRNKSSLADPLHGHAGSEKAARQSHPAWLMERWTKRYGGKTTGTICRLNNTEPVLCLRVNNGATSVAAFLDLLRAAEITGTAGSFAPDAVLVHNYKGSVTELPGYDAGLFQVQDEAAQLIGLLLSPLQPGKSYLDGCAGLGGKTGHLARMLAAISRPDDPGQIVAVEPNRMRRELLQENLQRLALSSYVTIVADKLENLPRPWHGSFAGALIDAPCSGLGVIRRHPEIRWSRTAADLARYHLMQLALLETTAPLLAPCAILVYATCSMEPEENEEVVARFLAAHSDFSLTNCGDYLPPHGRAADLVDRQGFFRTLPMAEGMGGFFAARMTRKL